MWAFCLNKTWHSVFFFWTPSCDVLQLQRALWNVFMFCNDKIILESLFYCKFGYMPI